MSKIEELIDSLTESLYDAEDWLHQLESHPSCFTKQERIAIVLELCSHIQAFTEQYRRDLESLQQEP